MSQDDLNIPLDPKHFRQEICRKYGFSTEGYDRFIEDYEIIPAGEMPPDDDEPIDLPFEKICEKVDIPKNVLRRLQQENVVARPMTNADLFLLHKIKTLWSKPWFIRSQLVKMNQQKRESILTRPELIHKWERWAYSRFLFRQLEYGDGGRILNPKQRINIKEMGDFIQHVFGVPNKRETREKLAEIRKMANNDRYRAQKENRHLEEMAKNRGISVRDDWENAPTPSDIS